MVVAVVVAVVGVLLHMARLIAAVVVVVVVVVDQEAVRAAVHVIDVVAIHDHDRVHAIVTVVEVFPHVNVNVHAIPVLNELEPVMANELLNVPVVLLLLLVVVIVVDQKHLDRYHALDRIQNNVHHLTVNRPVVPMAEVDRVVQASTIVVAPTQLAHLALVSMQIIATIDHRSLPV